MKHDPNLTSSELANLWSTYMAESMNFCVMHHFILNAKDHPIKKMCVLSQKMSDKHLDVIKGIFKKDDIPLPIGFPESEVNTEAPDLFSDLFYLRYLENLARMACSVHGIALGTSYRSDVQAFFRSCLEDGAHLYNLVTDLEKEKGTLVRSPFIPYPNHVSFIKDTHYLKGKLTLNKRNLNALEITHISNNVAFNEIGRTLIEGFAQVTKNPETAAYFAKGMVLSKEIVRTLTQLLEEGEVATPFSSDSVISMSTVSPFSDKLMMALVDSLCAASIGILGASLAASMRSDIAMEYTQLMAKVAKFAHDGAVIAINNGWMEKPPHAVDRAGLKTQSK